MGTPTSCGRQRLAGARHLGECDGEPPEDDGVGGGLPVCQVSPASSSASTLGLPPPPPPLVRSKQLHSEECEGRKRAGRCAE